MENPPIAKEISKYEENNGRPITVTTREVIYVSGENNAELGSGSYINMDEEVKVEEKYCGPITCILGTVLFFVFLACNCFYGMLFV